MYTNQHPEIQPDALNEILALRPEGAENCKKPVTDLIDRMKGAVIGRFAGCVLGIPVELYKMADMQALAMECNMQYPPRRLLDRHRPARKNSLSGQQENGIYS